MKDSDAVRTVNDAKSAAFAKAEQAKQAEREATGLEPSPTNLPGSTTADRVDTAMQQVANYYQPPQGGKP